MKVVQIIPRFTFGGAEIMCENLSVALHKAGVEVIVVSLYDYHSAITERLEQEGIQVIYLSKKLGLDFSIFIKLCRLFRREKPDALHTHLNVIHYTTVANLFSGVPRQIHTLHSIASKESTQIGQIYNNLAFRIFRVIPVALSNSVRDTIVERYKIPAKKIPVIYNGINLDRCMIKKDYESDTVFQFLHIGRFNEAKNHLVFLEAFRDLCETDPNVHLTLVGEGELENQIKAKINNLHLNDKVTLFGTTDNVYPLLHDADAFILPSAYEGMPMTLIEAMATGLPIAATNVGGIPDMLQNGKEAILTDVSREGILEGLQNILTTDQRETYGKNARMKAAKHFSSEKMASKYMQLYKLNADMLRSSLRS